MTEFQPSFSDLRVNFAREEVQPLPYARDSPQENQQAAADDVQCTPEKTCTYIHGLDDKKTRILWAKPQPSFLATDFALSPTKWVIAKGGMTTPSMKIKISTLEELFKQLNYEDEKIALITPRSMAS